MSSTPYNPTRETCEYCGKSFICHLPEEYAYKRKVSYRSDFTHRVFFCSWKCLRAWETAREAEREEKQRQREARKKAQQEEQEKKPAGAVRPTTEVKTRHTIHRCGVCGKRVAMTSTHCKYCDTEIDWGVYRKKHLEPSRIQIGSSLDPEHNLTEHSETEQSKEAEEGE